MNNTLLFNATTTQAHTGTHTAQTPHTPFPARTLTLPHSLSLSLLAPANSRTSLLESLIPTPQIYPYAHTKRIERR
jgi:hypothetical protein